MDANKSISGEGSIKLHANKDLCGQCVPCCYSIPLESLHPVVFRFTNIWEGHCFLLNDMGETLLGNQLILYVYIYISYPCHRIDFILQGVYCRV